MAKENKGLERSFDRYSANIVVAGAFLQPATTISTITNTIV